MSWCPKNPNLFVSASFDGSVRITSYQNASISAGTTTARHRPADDEPTSPKSAAGQAPKWLGRQIGASFGGRNQCAVFFAGKRVVATLRPVVQDLNQARMTVLRFERDLQEAGPASVCTNNLDSSSNADSVLIWKLLRGVSAQDMRREILEIIGFKIENLPHVSVQHNDAAHQAASSISLSRVESEASIFGDESANHADSHDGSESDFSLFPDSLTDMDKLITDKLVMADIEAAVMVCLNAKRYADAMIIASCRGAELRAKVEDRYVKECNSIHLRIARSIASGNLADITEHASLASWKDILAMICTYADSKNIYTLSHQFALRLTEAGHHLAACCAFLVAQSFDDVLGVLLAQGQEGASNCDLSRTFHTLFRQYQIIRVMECSRPGLLVNCSNSQTQMAAYEVIVKLRYLLTLSGFIREEDIPVHISAECKNAVSGKNEIVDYFVESGTEVVQLQAPVHPVNPVAQIPTLSQNAPSQYSVAPASQSFAESFKAAAAPAQLRMSPAWMPASPKAYNDAPIVNPRGSKKQSSVTDRVASLAVSGGTDHLGIHLQLTNCTDADADLQPSLVLTATHKLIHMSQQKASVSHIFTTKYSNFIYCSRHSRG